MQKQVHFSLTILLFCLLEETKANSPGKSQGSFVRDIANIPCSKQFPKDYDPNWSANAASMPYSKEDEMLLGDFAHAKENEATLDSMKDCLCGVQCSCPLSCACRQKKSLRAQSLGQSPPYFLNRLAIRSGSVPIQNEAQVYDDCSLEANPPPAQHCCNLSVDNKPATANLKVESDTALEKNNNSNAAVNEDALFDDTANGSINENTAGLTDQNEADSSNENTANLDIQNSEGSSNENTESLPNGNNVHLENQNTEGLSDDEDTESLPNGNNVDLESQNTEGLSNENTAELSNPKTEGLTNENTASLAEENTIDLNNENSEGVSNENSVELIYKNTVESTNQNNPGLTGENETYLNTISRDSNSETLAGNIIDNLSSEADDAISAPMKDTLEAFSVKKDTVPTYNDEVYQSEATNADDVNTIDLQPNTNGADSLQVENIDTARDNSANTLSAEIMESMGRQNEPSNLSDEGTNESANKLQAINPKELEFARSKSNGFVDEYNEEIRSKRDLLDTMESIEPKEDTRQADCYN